MHRTAQPDNLHHLKRLPTVMCPGCRTPMAAAAPKKHAPTQSGLEDITYTCNSCGMKTRRRIKLGHK